MNYKPSEIFYAFTEARTIAESRCLHYNIARPHGALGCEPQPPEDSSCPSQHRQLRIPGQRRSPRRLDAIVAPTFPSVPSVRPTSKRQESGATEAADRETPPGGHMVRLHREPQSSL